LLRRQSLPLVVVIQHSPLLIGRQTLEALVVLHDLLALMRRQKLVMRIRLAQLVAPRFGKFPPLSQPGEHLLTFFRR